MKKIAVFLLILILAFSVVACVEEDNQEEEIAGDFEMNIIIGGVEFAANLYDNNTAKAFAETLPMTVAMSDMTHEKYYYLPSNLPTAAVSVKTIEAGDIMLWGSNCLVLFYESFSTLYSYSRIGKIEDAAGLAAAVGIGNIAVTFSIK